MEPAVTMPNVIELATRKITAQEWLQYYQNIWTRNAVARTVDVKVDEALKAINPEEPVESGMGDGQVIAVKERLEHRKILVQDALDISEAIGKLIAHTPEEFEKAEWSKEALAVAPDMLPVPSNVMGETPAEVDAEHEPAEKPVQDEPATEGQPEETAPTPAEEPAAENNQA